MPIISVVLPVHNAEKYISEAVKSILDQTLSDFEFIIINDASTDRTLEILQGFNDSRISVVTNETNLGLVKTLNKGLDLAQCEFIARMDGDDISHPKRFEKQIAFLRKNTDVDICGSLAQVFGGKNYIRKPLEKHEDIKAQLLFLNRIVHPSLMFRRQSLINHNVHFDERFVKCEDYGLWVEIIDKLKFATLPEVLLDYRIHEENFSIPRKSNWETLKAWNLVVYEILFKRLGVQYCNKELNFQLNLGFKIIDSLSKYEFKEYMIWFEKLLLANKKSRYFNHRSLNNEILNQILFLGTRKEDTGLGAYYDVIIKAVLKHGLLFQFIRLRMKYILESLLHKKKEDFRVSYVQEL